MRSVTCARTLATHARSERNPIEHRKPGGHVEVTVNGLTRIRGPLAFAMLASTDGEGGKTRCGFCNARKHRCFCNARKHQRKHRRGQGEGANSQSGAAKGADRRNRLGVEFEDGGR